MPKLRLHSLRAYTLNRGTQAPSCPLLALSGHFDRGRECPLSRVKRSSRGVVAIDPAAERYKVGVGPGLPLNTAISWPVARC